MKLFNKTYLSFRIIVSFCFIVLFTQSEVRKFIYVIQYSESEELETGKEESKKEEKNEEYRLAEARVYQKRLLFNFYKEHKTHELYISRLNKHYINALSKIFLKHGKLTFYE